MSVKLMLGDCLERMGEIEDGSVDLIAADLPYQITTKKWDILIPFDGLWPQFKRIIKPSGALIFTASQPFTSALVLSNPSWFRYSLVWHKKTTSGFLNAKKMPLRGHEDIIVFYEKLPTYNPQKRRRTDQELKRLGRSRETTRMTTTEFYRGKMSVPAPNRIDNADRYPDSVISIAGLSRETDRGLHPTQKPVPLFEYLIKTYSNEGETVLDCTMGSGTTGVACLNTGRSFIGIELDPSYFATASSRIADAQSASPLFAEA